ncbi:sucrose-specific PTS transporter subunit IIBC [Enterococcus quebecensis]|uniref:protein-N(pi)-phosphohistidine--sucrose phosphotransferase n=1 Tax=Enterococcus quebecensis TaxID=903983 RepID=A0A1E5GR28_9ENTE|nr:sucrose-specific PTS transporter subunit IIBC [Enterococcus quebecensis]OEG15178.1 PTS maltose transporter subunit IIBC [Enterococcus quebecensis]OJG74755.1 PTS system, sucrose-specific IIBC component [Enterococcus quebecensis]
MNYKKIAEEILQALGGKENIEAATHCATRLRVVLKDDQLKQQSQLESIEVIKGTFDNAGQFQIILGSGTVNEVYAEFAKLTELQEMSTKELKEVGSKKLNPIQRGVKMLSDIFIPIIPAIVACGLMMGLNNIFTAEDLFFKGQSLITAYPQFEGIAAMINTFSNAAYVFLPVLIGFSAAGKFGGNPYLGATLGMIMVHPDLMNAYNIGKEVADSWNLFGFHIEKIGYQGTVLPILVAAYLLAKIEKALRKIIPSVLDNLLTPLLTLFITAFLTFVIVGPVTREAGNLVTDGLIWLYENTGFIGGGIIGLFYAPLVITGMHHSFIAVETQLLAEVANTGGTFIFPIASMSNVAQGAACLGVLFITKNEKIKSLATASSISAYLGITEPAMFGVNLKLRYPFFAAMIGSCVGSAFITAFRVKAVALGAAGLPGVIAITPSSILVFVFGLILTTLVTLGATFILIKTGRGTDEIVNDESQSLNPFKRKAVIKQ